MAGPSAQHQRLEPEHAPVPLIAEPALFERAPFDAPINVANSRAARHFAGMSLASALLAVASAALFYRSAGASGSVLIAAVDCFIAAVILQIFARRWMRRELAAEGLRQGLDERTARRRARAAVTSWLRKPHA
jgi:hypothetical protein